MASLAQIITISSRRQSAVWRECQGCTALAPLAPDATHCKSCTANPQTRTARRSARAA